MAQGVTKGDRVSWKAGSATARGVVQRVIKGRAKHAGKEIVGTPGDPRYVVKNEQTGKTVVRRGASLTKLRAKSAAKRRPRAAAKSKARRLSLPPLRVPRPRRPSRPSFSWKWAAAAVAVLVLAGGAYAYFTRVPDRLADDYRKQAGPAFETVDESMYDVFTTFRSRFFRGLAIKDFNQKRLGEDISELRRVYRKQYATDRATIERANTAIAAAEAAIDDAEGDLTQVDSWPLLDGVGELGDADDDAEQASEYLAEAREFMPLYREVIAYSKQTLTIEEEITNAILDESPGDAASLETYRSSVNATLARLGKARKKLDGLKKAPEDATAFHYATDAGLKMTTDFFETLDAAFTELNPGLIDQAYDEIDKRVKAFGFNVFRRFNELQDESDVGEAIGDIEDAEDDLADELGAEAGDAAIAPSVLPSNEKDRDKQA